MPLIYEDLLAQAVEQDERVIIMTAENRAPVRGLPPKIGKRFLDVGITEQTMIGMAAGMALRGRVVVCHALATFAVFRPYEFIRNDVCIPNLPVKIVGWVPGILSDANGPTHQAIEDISIMRGLPNMKVYAPASVDELMLGFPHILADMSPWYMRYNPRPAVWTPAPFEIGKAEVVREGKDVAILTYGALAKEAYEAAELLGAKGISVHFVNVRTPKPIDEAAIVRAARGTRLLVTVEDHFATGGLGTIAAEVCMKHRVLANHLSIAFDGKWFTPTLLGPAIEAEGMSGPQIADRITAALAAVKNN